MNEEGLREEVNTATKASLDAVAKLLADEAAFWRVFKVGGVPVPCRKVNYLFAIQEEVITDLGDEGIVTALMTERTGRKYLVRTRRMETWYGESEIKKTPENEAREDKEREVAIRERHVESLSDDHVKDLINPELEAGMVELMKKMSVYRDELEAMDSLDLEIMFLEQSLCGYHSPYLASLKKEREGRDAKVDSIEKQIDEEAADCGEPNPGKQG